MLVMSRLPCHDLDCMSGNNSLLLVLLICVGMTTAAAAQESKLKIRHETIDGPAQPEMREDWFKRLSAWRTRHLAELHYDGSLYARPELAWRSGPSFNHR